MHDRNPAVEGTIFAAATVPLGPGGVPNLDLVLGGGMLRSTLLIAVGPPGCGRTTLATQMAYAAARAKMRFSPHDLTLREFTISAPVGIEVRAPFESERGVLAGIARQQSEPPSGMVAMPTGSHALRRRGRTSRRAEDPPQGGS
jgi:hypothetical protein